MKINIYAIKDTKLGRMAQPFYAPNDEIAKRMLIATTRQEGNSIAEFAEDYQLFKLGNYDEVTGELTSGVEFLMEALEAKNYKIKEEKKEEKKEEE